MLPSTSMVTDLPSGFGLEILHEIPRGASKEEFEEWVRLAQEYFDAKYEELHFGFYEHEYVTDDPLTEHAEWTYEIDLDNLVFLVNRFPMFRLDNMPPDDVFLKSISYDHFGNTALHKLTPIQFRYNWRAPPPPPPPKSLIVYRSCPNRSSTSPIHELLCIPTAWLSIERARTALIGPLITRFMIEGDVSCSLRHLETVPDRNHIPESMLQFAFEFVKSAAGPPNPSLWWHNPLHITWDFEWIREDVCLRITTHLDDEENFQASIGDLILHINKTHKAGTFYGIACSIFHCAIVRLDIDERGTSFAHTPALQFLSSFYAREISTPGIEALSRLGCQASGVEILNSISEGHHRPRLTHGASESVASKVPVELWRKVGSFITSPIDLVNLAYISPQALSAAADLARYPWIWEYRLVDTVDSIPPIPETTEHADEEEIGRYYRDLGCAKFTAVVGGRRVTVKVCPRKDHPGMKSFTVKTYLDESFNLWEEGPYVLELDDKPN